MSSGLVLDTGELGYLHDYSRNHHTLTNHGATPVRGKFGKGMHFDGVNDYIDCGNDSSLDIADAITIEAWLIPLVITSGTYPGLVGKERTTSYMVRLVNNARPEMYIKTAGGIDNVLISSPLSITEYSYITATYDGGDMKLYSNGVLNKMETHAFGGNIGIDANDLIIGKRPSLSQYFNGVISSIKIYNRALSADEIKIAYLSKGYTSPLQKSPMGIE